MPDDMVDRESKPSLPTSLSALDSLRFAHAYKDCEISQLSLLLAERAVLDAKAAQVAKQRAYVDITREIAARYQIAEPDSVDFSTGVITRGPR